MRSASFTRNRCWCQGDAAAAVYIQKEKNNNIHSAGKDRLRVFFPIFFYIFLLLFFFVFGCKVREIVKNNKPISPGWLGLGGGGIVRVDVNDPASEAASRLSGRVSGGRRVGGTRTRI